MNPIHQIIFSNISKGVTNNLIEKIRAKMYIFHDGYRETPSAWQTDGQKSEDIFPEIEEFIKNSKHTDADTFIEATGAKIEFDFVRAGYCPKQDRIDIPRTSRYINLEEYYRALFHELAHWTDHECRLPRDSRNVAKEETVVEIASALLCHEFNIQPHEDRHIEYIAKVFADRNLKGPIPANHFEIAAEIAEYLLQFRT